MEANNRSKDWDKQKHVHEVLGSTAVVDQCGEECHNHRFATYPVRQRKRVTAMCTKLSSALIFPTDITMNFAVSPHLPLM